MPLLLSRASAADVRELVDLHYTVIQGPLSDILIGYDTEDGRQAAAGRWAQEMKEDPADLWLKVIDSETGRIVSTAHWKIYPTWVPIKTGPASLDWIPEGEERALAEEIIHTFYQFRAQHQHGSPHVCESAASRCRGSVLNLGSTQSALHSSGLSTPWLRRHACQDGLWHCRWPLLAGMGRVVSCRRASVPLERFQRSRPFRNQEQQIRS